MHFTSLVITALSLGSTAWAQTITLDSAQSAAYVSAVRSFYASVTTDPGFAAMESELATATGSGISNFLSVASQISAAPGISTAAEASRLSSAIAGLPTTAQSFYRSVYSVEQEIISSVLALDSTTTSGGTVSATANAGAIVGGGQAVGAAAAAIGAGAGLLLAL